MFESARNRDFSPKRSSEEISGIFPDFGFSPISRSGSIQKKFQRRDAQKNSLSAGINIRMKKMFEFTENPDSSPFCEFSSFSGFRRFMIFVIKRRIDPRTSRARRCRKNLPISRDFHLNEWKILIRQKSSVCPENYTGQNKFIFSDYISTLSGRKPIEF